jgi:cell division protein FtsB
MADKGEEATNTVLIEALKETVNELVVTVEELKAEVRDLKDGKANAQQ